MSEKHHKNIEVLEASKEHYHENLKPKVSNIETSKVETRQAEQLRDARAEVVKESAEGDKLLDQLRFEQPAESETSNMPVGAELKQLTFRREIKHIRKKLSKPDRFGSRVIHQPIIKSASEISSKTITRPSGLLGGGITAFLGTSIYLYLTKYIGLKYNYSMFLFLLIAGFLIGLALEAVIRLYRSSKSI